MNARRDLGTLEASGLIQVAARQPELEYLFRHALVQDAAYGSLLKQDRRALHKLAAQTLLSLYPDRRREMAGVLAMHYERAGDAAAAAEYLVISGEHALERFANREAQTAFEHALALMPSEDPRTELRIRAALGATKGGWSYAGPDEGIARLEAALTAGEEHADRSLLADAYFWLAFLYRQRGETPQTSEVLRRVLDRSREFGDAPVDAVARAIPRAFEGMGLMLSGHLREGAAMAEDVLRGVAGALDPLSEALVRDIVTITYARLGDFASAEASVALSERLAERGDPIARLDAMIARSAILIERGDVEEGASLATRCAATSEELGAAACSLSSSVLAGAARLAQDDVMAAKGPLERGREISIVVNLPPMRTLAQGLLGSVQARLGDRPAGVAGWDEALGRAHKMDDRYGEATVRWRRAQALAHEDPPDWSGALADLDAATRLFEMMEARPALARIARDRGAILRSLGRTDEADAAERRSRDLGQTLGLKDFANH